MVTSETALSCWLVVVLAGLRTRLPLVDRDPEVPTCPPPSFAAVPSGLRHGSGFLPSQPAGWPYYTTTTPRSLLPTPPCLSLQRRQPHSRALPSPIACAFVTEPFFHRAAPATRTATLDIALTLALAIVLHCRCHCHCQWQWQWHCCCCCCCCYCCWLSHLCSATSQWWWWSQGELWWGWQG